MREEANAPYCSLRRKPRARMVDTAVPRESRVHHTASRSEGFEACRPGVKGYFAP
jgi:hypothetical protein